MDNEPDVVGMALESMQLANRTHAASTQLLQQVSSTKAAAKKCRQTTVALAGEMSRQREVSASIAGLNEELLSIGDILTHIESDATRLTIAKARQKMLSSLLVTAKSRLAGGQAVHSTHR